MTVTIIIFLFLTAIAAGVAIFPLMATRQNRWLAIGFGLVILLVGLGGYSVVGRPELAARAITGLDPNDFRALVAILAARIRERPNDATGWILLGKSYLALNTPDQATKALARAIEISEESGAADASVYSAYGEALSQEAGGITPEAEAAFQKALARDPHESNARYYLGLAARARGDKKMALYYWEGLLADAPADASWRHALTDDIAALRAEEGAAPDMQKMISGLAQRLEDNPRDLEGWMRLIRAYTVIGEAQKARDALARARTQFARDKPEQDTLHALAQDLGLEAKK